MTEQCRECCVQEQDCLSYGFQVIISNSPSTGKLGQVVNINLSQFRLHREF